MIQLLTLTGAMTIFWCADIFYMIDKPAIEGRKAYCEVAIVSEHVSATASIATSCEKVLKLCKDKARKF